MGLDAAHHGKNISSVSGTHLPPTGGFPEGLSRNPPGFVLVTLGRTDLFSLRFLPLGSGVMNNIAPIRANVIVLKHTLDLIPRGLLNRHALETAMLFAQLSHAMGRNNVCDWLRLKSAALACFGITPPPKHGRSNATTSTLQFTDMPPPGAPRRFCKVVRTEPP